MSTRSEGDVNLVSRWHRSFAAIVLLMFTPLLPAAAAATPPTSREASAVPGYIRDLPPESTEARAARHAEVARRFTGTPVLVHRGASKIAPENTLEAYAAAGAAGDERSITHGAGHRGLRRGRMGA